MSKLNSIQTALIQIDGGRFQKLIESYLFKKRGFDNVASIGAVPGKDKSRTGTPDICYRLATGKYVFVECTTKANDLFAKLRDDLNKDIDPRVTGVELSELSEIVLCFTGDLKIEEESALRNTCTEKGIKLTVNNLNTISQDLFHYYPGLSKDFLGVSVDTGQILDIDDFVTAYGKNKLVAPLETSFKFREKEIESILAGLESTDVALVSGVAGVGKSRIAIESCRLFKAKNPDFIVKAILSRGPDIYDDLKTYFSSPGKYLVFIDDANRISGLDYFVNLLQNNSPDFCFKIIASVRDYAISKVKNKLREVGSISEISLSKMEDKQIRDLVKQEFGVNHPLYLDRISKISGGNPRLAVMAAKLAVAENTLESIRDVSTLYEIYFSSVQQDLAGLGNASLLKVAAIVAFLQKIDRTNSEIASWIEGVFGISLDEFWKGARQLHEMELLDMYEDEVVRVSDQVLATYVFYMAFFKEKTLLLSNVLESLFPRFRHRIIDSLNGIFTAFDEKTIMSLLRPEISKLWDKLEQQQDQTPFLQLLDSFWFVKQSETLLYIRNKISEFSEEKVEDTFFEESKDKSAGIDSESPSLLSILKQFNQTSNSTLESTIDLLLLYLEKKPSQFSTICKILIDSFRIDRHSAWREYEVERLVVNKVWKKSFNGTNLLFTKLFIPFGEHLLNTQFNDTESGNGRSFTFYQINLPATEEVFELRKLVWGSLFSIFKNGIEKSRVLDAIPRYGKSKYYHAEKAIIIKDSESIIPFIRENLDWEKYSDCHIAQSYFDLLDSNQIEYDPELRNKFKNDLFLLSKVVIFDSSDRRILHLDYSEGEAYRKKEIQKYFSSYKPGDYLALFSDCLDLKKEINAHGNDFLLHMGFVDALVDLSDKSASDFLVVMEKYLLQTDPFFQVSYFLAERLIVRVGPLQAKHVLFRPGNPNAKKWMFAYYYNLPSDFINTETAEQLVQLYLESEVAEMPQDLEYVHRKYFPVDSSIIMKISETIFGKISPDSNDNSPLASIFHYHSEIAKILDTVFATNPSLLEGIYFHVLITDQHADYEGQILKKLIKIDSKMLVKYIAWVYKNKKESDRELSRRFDFLWLREDFDSLLNGALQVIHSFEEEDDWYYDTYLKNLFFRVDTNNDLILERQNAFLSKLIDAHFADMKIMSHIFSVICDFQVERILNFVTIFSKHNKNFSDFKKLPIAPRIRSWSGSEIPLLEKEIDYFNSLLPIFSGIELLEHKSFFESKIQRCLQRIEEEKKRNFLED